MKYLLWELEFHRHSSARMKKGIFASRHGFGNEFGKYSFFQPSIKTFFGSGGFRNGCWYHIPVLIIHGAS